MFDNKHGNKNNIQWNLNLETEYQTPKNSVFNIIIIIIEFFTSQLWLGNIHLSWDVLLLLLLFTAIGLSPSGSGYFTCVQNMKSVITKFNSEGLHEKHVVATWNLGSHLSICF